MTKHTITVADGKLAAFSKGNGPLILALPGMGDRKEVYGELATLLSGAGFRFAALDLRGHGESSTGMPVSQSALRDDLLAAHAALGGGPALMIGQSYAPDAAVAAADRLAARGESLGAVAIAPWARTERPHGVQALLLRTVLSSPLLWSWFYGSLLKGRKPAHLREHLRAIRRSLRRKHGTDALVAMGDPDSKDLVAERSGFTVPTLVIMGELDPDFREPHAEAEDYANALGGATKIDMITEAGHYPHSQQPELVAASILAFLDEQRQPEGRSAGGERA